MIITERSYEEVLCQMAVEDNLTNLICGGIEEAHFNFLVWKKVLFFDAVLGNWRTALAKGVAGTLQQGEVFISEKDEALTL